LAFSETKAGAIGTDSTFGEDGTVDVASGLRGAAGEVAGVGEDALFRPSARNLSLSKNVSCGLCSLSADEVVCVGFSLVSDEVFAPAPTEAVILAFASSAATTSFSSVSAIK